MANRSQPELRRVFTLAGRDVAVSLRRSTRRSVGLLVKAEGLTVTLPNRFPLHELDALLHQKAGWIVDKLDELAARLPATALADGSSVDWLGEPRTVQLGYARGRVTADTLELVAHDNGAVPLALTRLMRREARSFLAERLDLWANRLGLRYADFKLSSARSRWGSCTAGRVIRLNWRLMQAPLPVLDYVVIHELCHLVEMNHSPDFWSLVARVCPDWKRKRDWLKREGGRYFAW